MIWLGLVGFGYLCLGVGYGLNDWLDDPLHRERRRELGRFGHAIGSVAVICVFAVYWPVVIWREHKQRRVWL
jgi:hypothetical protein